MKRLMSFILVVVLVLSFSTTAFASAFSRTNDQFTVVESNGIRTVTDNVTGAVVSYDMKQNMLFVQEAADQKAIVIDIDAQLQEYMGTKASSNNNEYAYSSTGNPALWTLQIPNQIKFTYERTQGALISSFVSNVDNIIEAEDNLIFLYGAGVVALLGIAVSGAIGAAIVALLGLGVDVTAIINSLTSINDYKENAEYYFGRIVTYSRP